MQYEREKKRLGENQHTEGGQKLPTQEKERTSQKLADQHKVSERTIRDDTEFARAIDKIESTMSPEGVEVKKAKENQIQGGGNRKSNTDNLNLKTQKDLAEQLDTNICIE